MSPEEHEAQLFAVADLSEINKRLVRDVISISKVIERIIDGEPRRNTHAVLSKFVTEGRYFARDLEGVLERMDELYETSRGKRVAQVKERVAKATKERERRARMAQARRDREDWWNHPIMDGDEFAEHTREAERLRAEQERKKTRRSPKREDNVVYFGRSDTGHDDGPPAA
jgi:hypothetical protein